MCARPIRAARPFHLHHFFHHVVPAHDAFVHPLSGAASICRRIRLFVARNRPAMGRRHASCRGAGVDIRVIGFGDDSTVYQGIFRPISFRNLSATSTSGTCKIRASSSNRAWRARSSTVMFGSCQLHKNVRPDLSSALLTVALASFISGE